MEEGYHMLLRLKTYILILRVFLIKCKEEHIETLKFEYKQDKKKLNKYIEQNPKALNNAYWYINRELINFIDENL